MWPVISLIRGWRTLADLKSASQCLLQNRDLPGMIELVLRDAMKHVIEVVPLSGNSVAEALIRKPFHCSNQQFMRFRCVSHSLLPRDLCRLRNRWKIVFSFELGFMASKPLYAGPIPRRNVKHEFPNAVNVSQRFRRRRFCINILQQFHQCRPVPGLAVEGAMQLIGNESGFGGMAVFLHNSLFCHDCNFYGIRRLDHTLPIQ